jgi:hypothetical protein
MLITYQGASSPNPVTGKTGTDAIERYEFWRDGPDPVRAGRRRQRRPAAHHHRFTAMAMTTQEATPPALEARSRYRFYRAG